MSSGGKPAEDSLALLRHQCAALGFDLDTASSELAERMRLLGERSSALDDATRMAGYAQRIFRHYDVERPAEAWSALERQTVVLGCLFSDIGKTGPRGSDEETRRVVAEAFSIDNVRDDSQPVATFLRTYFPADAEDRIARFAAAGIDPAMPLRKFWNLHSDWTLAIVEAAGLPPECVAAAATHHLLDDVNPRAIVGDDARFTRLFGANTAFDRAEKLVIVLDKYDAARRRGGLTHEEAIAWVRARIAKNPRFCTDAELRALVDVASDVLGG